MALAAILIPIYWWGNRHELGISWDWGWLCSNTCQLVPCINTFLGALDFSHICDKWRCFLLSLSPSNRGTTTHKSLSVSNFRGSSETHLPATSQRHSPALCPELFANFASLLCLSCSACIESLTYESYFSVKFNLFLLAAFLAHFGKSMKWGWNQRITHWILINCNESPFCRKEKK